MLWLFLSFLRTLLLGLAVDKGLFLLIPFEYPLYHHDTPVVVVGPKKRFVENLFSSSVDHVNVLEHPFPPQRLDPAILETLESLRELLVQSVFASFLFGLSFKRSLSNFLQSLLTQNFLPLFLILVQR